MKKKAKIMNIKNKILFFSLIFFLLFSCILPQRLYAAPNLEKGSIILDAEVSWIMKQFLRPIYSVAGLPTKEIEVYVIVDSSLNAFAVPGPAVFVHTGLLFEADTALDLLGVLAHETGHIARHHFSRRIQAYKDLQEKGILMGGLGLLFGMLAGGADAGMAGLMGGMDVAQKSAMSFTRGQEASADQAAMEFLDKLQWSSQGLYNFFDKLKKQALLPASRQSQFLRSHPLSQERMNYIALHIKKSAYKGKPLPKVFTLYFDRLKAKVYAYTASYSNINRLYPKEDKSIPAQYAQAILAYRKGNLKNALNQIDSLIKQYPEDPFFHDFRAVILTEQKKIDKAIFAYKTALKFLPKEPLYYLAIAQLYIGKAPSPLIDEKIRFYLKKAIQEYPSPMAWHMVAVVEGRKGNLGLVALALGEKNILLHNWDEAKNQAKRALHFLKKSKQGDSKKIQRAKDIISMTEIEKEKK